MSQPLDLASVNALDEAAFADAFGSVFEHFAQAAEAPGCSGRSHRDGAAWRHDGRGAQA